MRSYVYEVGCAQRNGSLSLRALPRSAGLDIGGLTNRSLRRSLSLCCSSRRRRCSNGGWFLSIHHGHVRDGQLLCVVPSTWLAHWGVRTGCLMCHVSPFYFFSLSFFLFFREEASASLTRAMCSVPDPCGSCSCSPGSARCDWSKQRKWISRFTSDDKGFNSRSVHEKRGVLYMDSEIGLRTVVSDAGLLLSSYVDFFNGNSRNRKHTHRSSNSEPLH